MRKVVRAKPVPKRPRANSTLRLLARLCYHYPQYTLAQARRLPAIRVKLLLEVAEQIEAERMIQLVQIAAAPHSKNGVKKLTSHYKGVLRG